MIKKCEICGKSGANRQVVMWVKDGRLRLPHQVWVHFECFREGEKKDEN